MLLEFPKLLNEYATLKISKKQFYSIMEENPTIFIKERSKIAAAEKLRASIIKERNLEVVYFTGASGSGKSTAAKYFATKLNYDYFVTGSGDDILDGYDKEECLILDDFRAGSMKFMEVLKMLDNNTNSSVKSRYNNKDLSNCKLIVITSVFKPNELYKVLQDEENEEPVEQFYRRLKHHFYLIGEDKEISEYTLKVGEIRTTGKCLGNMNTIYEELGIDPNKVDDTSLLDIFKQDSKSTEQEIF